MRLDLPLLVLSRFGIIVVAYLKAAIEVLDFSPTDHPIPLVQNI